MNVSIFRAFSIEGMAFHIKMLCAVNRTKRDCIYTAGLASLPSCLFKAVQALSEAIKDIVSLEVIICP